MHPISISTKMVLGPREVKIGIINDLEIDRTFHRLLRSPRSRKLVNSSSLNSCAIASNIANSGSDFDFDHASSVDYDFDIAISNSHFGICISQFSLDNMDNNDRTLKERTTPDIMHQPWCIRYLKWEQAQSYELKTRLTHLLPKFHGLASNTQQFGVTGFAASIIVNEVVAIAIGQHHINTSVRENVSTTSQNLQTEIGQLVTTVNQLQSKGSEQIPSETILSPQANMSDITLRSGKELPQPYLELQTSKLDNLGSPGKLRQISKIFLFTIQPSSTICSVKYGH
ncbi:hypothetical protein CR513_41420, partial [Mucuna pruriens]